MGSEVAEREAVAQESAVDYRTDVRTRCLQRFAQWLTRQASSGPMLGKR